MSYMYLKDLASLGCRFVPDGIHKMTKQKTYLTGQLYFNGHSYPVIVVSYKNRKPPKLKRILPGNNKELKKYIRQCVSHNVNNIAGNIMGRCFQSFFRIMVSLLMFITLVYTIYYIEIYGISSKSITAVVLALLLVFICMIVNMAFKKEDRGQLHE